MMINAGKEATTDKRLRLKPIVLFFFSSTIVK